MSHWLDKVVTLLTAETDDLRQLALLVGGNPETFYLGVDVAKIDFEGQNIEGMKFDFDGVLASSTQDAVDTAEKEVRGENRSVTKRHISVRSDFLANIMFELRTYLTTILGSNAVLMRDAERHGDQFRILTIVDSSGARLFSHVTSLEKLLPLSARAQEDDNGGGHIFIDTRDARLPNLVLDKLRRRRGVKALSRRSEVAAIQSLTQFGEKIAKAASGYDELLVRMLLSSDLSKKQREYVEAIIIATYHLVEYARNVSALAKLEAGQLAVRIAQLNMDDLLGELPTGLSYLMRQKKLAVGMHSFVEAPNAMQVDQNISALSILNVLSYVVDHSRNGLIQIEVQVSQSFVPALVVRVRATHPAPTPRFRILSSVQTDMRLVVSAKLLTALGGNLEMEGEGSSATILTIPIQPVLT